MSKWLNIKQFCWAQAYRLFLFIAWLGRCGWWSDRWQKCDESQGERPISAGERGPGETSEEPAWQTGKEEPRISVAGIKTGGRWQGRRTGPGRPCRARWWLRLFLQRTQRAREGFWVKVLCDLVSIVKGPCWSPPESWWAHRRRREKAGRPLPWPRGSHNVGFHVWS